MLHCVGKYKGEYEGYAYFRIVFLYALEKNGEGHGALIEKATEKFYNSIEVGACYDVDSLMYNRQKKLCSADKVEEK